MLFLLSPIREDTITLSVPHVEYFDSHCHLDPMRYGGDIEDVLQRARSAGVSRMTVIGTRH